MSPEEPAVLVLGPEQALLSERARPAEQDLPVEQAPLDGLTSLDVVSLHVASALAAAREPDAFRGALALPFDASHGAIAAPVRGSLAAHYPAHFGPGGPGYAQCYALPLAAHASRLSLAF